MLSKVLMKTCKIMAIDFQITVQKNYSAKSKGRRKFASWKIAPRKIVPYPNPI